MMTEKNSRARLFQIVYSNDLTETIPKGFEVLDNRTNERPDWREYWPIRRFLLKALSDHSSSNDRQVYGFFSPKFEAKVQLTAQEVQRKISRLGGGECDVMLFSPQADMGCFFRNVFEQAETFDPGITQSAQAFFDYVGISVKLDRLIMDSRQVVFSNFFVATREFWRTWFSLTEQLFSVCEGQPTPLQRLLKQETNYPGHVQRKVFILERIASVLLTIQANRWKVSVHNPFLAVWSLSGLRKYRDEAIISDALKLAFREQGFEAYGAVFERVRAKVNTFEEATVLVQPEGNQTNSALDQNPNTFKLPLDTAKSLRELQQQTDHLLKKRLFDEAVSNYRKWLSQPGASSSAIAWFGFATLLAQIERHVEAEGACRQALHLEPKLYVGYLNLGLLLEKLGRFEEACQVWKKGSLAEGVTDNKHRETLLSLLNQQGRLLEQLRQYAEAEDVMRKSLEIDERQAKVIHHWVHIRQKQCKWPVYEPFAKVTLRAMIEASSPLATMAESDDPAVQLACARRTVIERVSKPARRIAASHRYKHERIRLGYLSGDLCMHAVGLLMVELLEQHDKSRFEVYAYCWSKNDGSALQKRIRQSLDHHVAVGQLSDAQVIERMLADEIDIAVDLQGLTSGARPGILAAGAAPIQISYLGYPGSCAIPYVDYIVADSFVFPKALERHFEERPMRLQGCFQTSDRRRLVGSTPSRASLNLPPDKFVFCAFNNNYKFTESMFNSWMRIMKACPEAVLWLLGDNQWSISNMKAAARRHDVAEQRLLFAPRVAPPDYLARFTQADLYLDTFPYNAGTTANDVLWMGLPLLTRSGNTYISRMAGSLLHFAGLNQFICDSESSYEERAIELAKEPGLTSLREARARLTQLKKQGDLFNTERFARDFEERLIELNCEAS